MAEGAIPLSEIYAYMKIFEITNLHERRLFLERIKILDKIYLEFTKPAVKKEEEE